MHYGLCIYCIVRHMYVLQQCSAATASSPSNGKPDYLTHMDQMLSGACRLQLEHRPLARPISIFNAISHACVRVYQKTGKLQQM